MSLLVSRKPEFVDPHIYAASAEGHSLCFQPQALLDRGIPAELDYSSCAHNAVPGQSN
jgi:hypothetical protein